MAKAKIVDLCDQLVSTIATEWGSKGKDDLVERTYLARIGETELDSFLGRRVYVFPGTYDNNPLTRGQDQWQYTVDVLIIERCERVADMDEGDPLNRWLDERLLFVEQTVAEAIDFDGRADNFLKFTDSSSIARRVRTLSIETETYDEDLLSQHSIFRSSLKVVLAEEIAA